MTDSQESSYPVIVVEHGLRIDANTGEVLGEADRSDEWVPKTREEVERVLDKIGACDAELVAIEARRRALLANLDSQANDIARRREYYVMRYEGALRSFADSALKMTGGKTRTVKLDTGRLSFRTIPASLNIARERKVDAIAWAKSHAPDAVRVIEDVLITELKATVFAQQGESAGMETLMAQPWIEYRPPMDSFVIDTGIAKSKSAAE